MSTITKENDYTAVVTQPSEPEPRPTKTTRTRKSPKTAKAAKKGGKSSGTKTVKKRAERNNKKAEVLALMRRPKGATLSEIVSLTGWQKHTVRGFVSIVGKKGEVKIKSSKNAAGERTYTAAK